MNFQCKDEQDTNILILSLMQKIRLNIVFMIIAEKAVVLFEYYLILRSFFYKTMKLFLLCFVSCNTNYVL